MIYACKSWRLTESAAGRSELAREKPVSRASSLLREFQAILLWAIRKVLATPAIEVLR